MTESTTDTPTAWELAKPLMADLGETQRMPRVQISRTIATLGLDVVQAVLVETRETEAKGGLLRKDGERRTIGGVFFALLKTHATREQYQRIFWPKPQRKAAPAPPPEPEPSEQAIQIVGVIVEKLKVSAKRQKAIARDVDRVGVAQALAALRATLKVEQQGGRTDTDGKRIKPLQVWHAVVDMANKQAA